MDFSVSKDIRWSYLGLKFLNIVGELSVISVRLFLLIFQSCIITAAHVATTFVESVLLSKSGN